MSITERQRTALELRVHERLTYKEIGLKLGIHEQAAKDRVDRALAAAEVGLRKPVAETKAELREKRRAALRESLEQAHAILFEAGIKGLDADMSREWRGTVDAMAKLDGLNEPVRTEMKLDLSKWSTLPPEEVREKVTEFVRENIAILGPIVDAVRFEEAEQVDVQAP